MTRIITSHIHSKIQKLAEVAIAEQLIEECLPSYPSVYPAGQQGNPSAYVIRLKGEIVGITYTPIAAATLLLAILNPELLKK